MTPAPIQDVIDDVRETASDDDHVSIGEIVEAFGGRTFGALTIVPAILLASPIGGIPGAPAVIATLVLLVSAQHALGVRSLWLPSKLKKHQISKSRLDGALNKLQPWTKRLDKLTARRLTLLVRKPMSRVHAGVIAILALLVFPMGLVPFAVFVPALGMVLLSLAMLAHDGLLALLGLLFAGGTLALVWNVVM